MDPERIPLAIAALAVCAIIGMVSGPVSGNANPFLWLMVDKLFGGLGDRLDKVQRPRGDLVFRGFLLSALVMFCAIFLGKILTHIVWQQHFNGLTEILLVTLFISAGSIWFALLRLYFAMEKQEIGKGAYFAISRSARTNLTANDDFGITRTAMNFSARSFDKALVSPIFWYLIGGLPLLILYSALAGLAWRFGKSGFSKGFGSVPLVLERLLGFVPSAFAALLITLASFFTPTAGLGKAISAWAGIKNRSPYEQGGLPLSALAWGLNVSLGGASQDINGSAVKAAWTGPEGATAQLDHHHLRRALYINVIAHILFLATLSGAYVCSGA
jgi:adenosylcobinamide-phosphate synthase